MEYRELGKTGLKVPVLSFGASSLGGVFHSINEAEAIKAVFTAVENGLNFIDVSPYYGHYKAETVLGKALKELPRDSFVLSTKVGRYGKDGVNTWDYSGKRATESVYESMERLNIDYIDLINVHDIEFADLNQVVGETLPALVELREKGVVGHVGITDLQLENLKWVLDNSPEGTVESVLNFCHHTLNDDKLVDFLDYFEEKGLGICYLGTTIYNAGPIIEALNLPRLVVPIVTVTLGYPANPLPAQSERLPLAAILHEETYADYTPARIDALYAEKEALKVNQRFVAENGKETLAQVFTEVRYTKANNEYFSTAFLEVLKKQGFLTE